MWKKNKMWMCILEQGNVVQYIQWPFLSLKLKNETIDRYSNVFLYCEFNFVVMFY